MLRTVHEYAQEESGESGVTALMYNRFVRYCRELAERAEPKLYGADQKASLDLLQAEHVNMTAALSFLRDHGPVEEGLRLAGALGWFWFRRARFLQGLKWLSHFRSVARDNEQPAALAKVSYYLGWMKMCVSRSFDGIPEGVPFFRESLRLYRESGDKRGAALCMSWLAAAEFDWSSKLEQGDDEKTARVARAVDLARKTGDPWTIAWSIKLSDSLYIRRHADKAANLAAMEEALALSRRTGDPFLVCQMLKGIGDIHRRDGDYLAALPLYRESLDLAREIDDRFCIVDTSNRLAGTFLDIGNLAEASMVYARALRLAADIGARGYYGWLIDGLDHVARRRGRMARAACLWGAAAALGDGCTKACVPDVARDLGVTEELAEARWRKGQSMTTEQAIDYALSDQD